MSSRLDRLAESLRGLLDGRATIVPSCKGEITIEVPAARLLEVAGVLRDDEAFRFEMLVDLCGVDYLTYGRAEWDTDAATNEGFSRAASRDPDAAAGSLEQQRRFAVVSHLLSISRNVRLRLRCFCEPGQVLVMPSLTTVWPAADWYEREAFDLFGIHFEGHPDLRRLLTDYGFIGHPFRKDFPTSGHVEVRYDAAKGRVVYQPVSIDPRVLVPRIIRDDNRYLDDLKDRPGRV